MAIHVKILEILMTMILPLMMTEKKESCCCHRISFSSSSSSSPCIPICPGDRFLNCNCSFWLWLCEVTSSSTTATTESFLMESSDVRRLGLSGGPILLLEEVLVLSTRLIS